MTKKKHDVEEWVTARQAASILTATLGRNIRPDSVHRMASRLGIPVHKIDERHWLYLESAVRSVS